MNKRVSLTLSGLDKPMSAKPLSRTEISLHWIVGLSVIGLLCVGFYMSKNEVYSLYPIHKSVGTLLFIFILARSFIRLRKGWPEPISTGQKWEHGLARLIHWVLILGTLIMPLSGITGSYWAGRGIAIFELELVGMNLSSDGQVAAVNAGLSMIAGRIHNIVGWTLVGAIALHVLGALKHHFIDRDNTLRRMLGRSIS